MNPALHPYAFLSKAFIRHTAAYKQRTLHIFCSQMLRTNIPGVWLLNIRSIIAHYMMTSSNGNIFRVTGPFWGESTGHRWIPLTNASDAELWCCLRLNKRLSKQSRRRWFETPSRSSWHHCNDLISVKHQLHMKYHIHIWRLLSQFRINAMWKVLFILLHIQNGPSWSD